MGTGQDGLGRPERGARKASRLLASSPHHVHPLTRGETEAQSEEPQQGAESWGTARGPPARESGHSPGQPQAPGCTSREQLRRRERGAEGARVEQERPGFGIKEARLGFCLGISLLAPSREVGKRPRERRCF